MADYNTRSVRRSRHNMLLYRAAAYWLRGRRCGCLLLPRGLLPAAALPPAARLAYLSLLGWFPLSCCARCDDGRITQIRCAPLQKDGKHTACAHGAWRQQPRAAQHTQRCGTQQATAVRHVGAVNMVKEGLW